MAQSLLLKIVGIFFSLGSMQRKLGIFGGKVFHQVCVEQFGSWPLEMIYTLLMVSFLVCYSSFNILSPVKWLSNLGGF